MSELPKKWKLSTIKDACKTVKGKKPKNSGDRSVQRTIPYINIRAFESGLAEQFAEPGEYPTCNEDDVLIVWDGARSGLIGRGVSGFIGSTLARISCQALDNSFLFYFLHSKYGEINSRTKGVGIPHVDPQVLNSIKIPLPPQPEQRRIIAEIEKQFSRLEEGVNALKRVQANLKRYRAAVLKAACEGLLVETEAELYRKRKTKSSKLGFETGEQLLKRILEERRKKWSGRGKYKEPTAPDTTNLPKLPEGWTCLSIDQMCSHITSGSRDWSKYYGKGVDTFIMAQNVRPMFLDMSERQSVAAPVGDAETERTRVNVDDLLVTIVGAKTGDVCRVSCQLDNHFVCQSVALLRPVISTLSSFMEFYLASQENGQAQWRGYIYGQGRPHLGFEQIRMTVIPLPPLAEQKRIVEEVERRLSVVEELESLVTTNLQRASRLRQSILQKAFTGNLITEECNRHE